ncbi:hypothetical protein [Granulicella sp. dw_53]|uniref:hypothetical protein n=1 Tax=Granulicella sp. dw_53 TaxID=2719792 RepID=UPI001BD6CCC1|nr:hypothetical protein [Granulicella sp. dw_53]
MEPIALPLIPALRAEDIWTAHCKLRKEEYAEALRKASCPEGARLISLISVRRAFLAMVDEEDYEWLSCYDWHAWTRRGYLNVRAVALIDGKPRQMSRLVMRVGHRYTQVRCINGNQLDNRKMNLQMLTTKQSALPSA